MRSADCCRARFDDRATGRVSQFCPNAKVIHIDIDPAELDKIKTANIAVCGDVKHSLACLLDQVKAQARATWGYRVAELKRMQPLRFPGEDNPRSHYGLIRAVAACVDECGDHRHRCRPASGMWVAQAYPLRRPRQWLTWRTGDDGFWLADGHRRRDGAAGKNRDLLFR